MAQRTASPPERVISLPDPLSVEGIRRVEERLADALSGTGGVVLDLRGVERVDTFGLAALGAALRRLAAAGRSVRVLNAPPRAHRLGAFLHMDQVLGASLEAEGPRPPALERLGAWGMERWEGAVTFLATLAGGYRHAALDAIRGGPVRREHFVRQVSAMGAGGLPIVALINFMIGVILAIQMAYVLRGYGAVIFIARGVGISVTREIGPLLAAILVAGRSGSAMAAEIGTMVVTEEVDALEMMALSPRRFLLSPRFAALTFAVPALCLAADLFGLLGGAAMGVLQYKIGWYTYYEETIRSVRLNDLGSGLVKSFFFGNLIATIGCLQGLRLRGGPESVGKAATTSVVKSIVAVILFDAVFTTLTKEIL